MKRFSLLVFTLISFFGLAADVPDVTAKDVLDSNNQDWLILDVRSEQEFAEGHVPGAINIAHTELADNLDKVWAYKDKTIVVYCRSGRRAGMAAQILLDNDFSQVKHLEGDIQGWQKANHPLEKPQAQ